MSSWFGTNETTEQAQQIVNSLQEELQDRDEKLQEMEEKLHQEKTKMEHFLQRQIDELTKRKFKLTQQVQQIDSTIAHKQKILHQHQQNLTQENQLEEEEEENDDEFQDCQQNSDDNTPPPPMEIVEKKVIVTETKETKTKSISIMNDQLLKVSAVDPNVAFIIQRSTNSNTVVYAGSRRSPSQSKLNASNPLDVYWIMYEQDGNPREELNLIERKSAYGASFTPHPSKNNHFIISLSSLRDRKLTLYINESNQIRAMTTIDGQDDMWIERVYVESTTSWGLPVVAYIEIFGVNPKTGQQVYEKKLNK